LFAEAVDDAFQAGTTVYLFLGKCLELLQFLLLAVQNGSELVLQLAEPLISGVFSILPGYFGEPRMR
jgi:hypothetical protein